MDDLEKRIQETVSRKMNDGTIEKMIEEQMEKAVKTALDDVFSYNGEGKKLLKEKFESVMCPTIEKHDFNKYVVKLDEVLTEIINNTRLAENKQILENFEYLIKDDDIKTINLSDIFKEYCKFVGRHVSTDDLEVYTDDYPSYQDVTAVMEVTESGYFTKRIIIKFSCEEDENLTVFAELYKYTIKDEKEYSILTIESDNSRNVDIMSLRYMNNFEIFLRKLRSCFARITVNCGGMSEEVEVEAKPEASFY